MLWRVSGKLSPRKIFRVADRRAGREVFVSMPEDGKVKAGSEVLCVGMFIQKSLIFRAALIMTCCHYFHNCNVISESDIIICAGSVN
jgi:hypothetical protein